MNFLSLAEKEKGNGEHWWAETGSSQPKSRETRVHARPRGSIYAEDPDLLNNP
jgi:hypothetical protein